MKRPLLRPLTPAVQRCLVASIVLIVALTQIVGNRTPDFLQDYAAAWAWRHGRQVDEPTTVLAEECWPEHGFNDLPWLRQPHPPAATLLALPLAGYEFAAARWLWAMASAIALATAWQVLGVSASVCLATAPLWCVALVLGTHEPLLAACIAGGAALVDARPRVGGLLLGLAVAVKGYPAVLLAGLSCTRHWRSLATALAVPALSFVVGEEVFGPGSTQRWLQYAADNTARYVDVAQNGSLVRMLRQVVPVAPAAGAMAIALALAGPLWGRVRQIGRSGRLDALPTGRTLVLGLIPVMLLASPLSWRHYAGLVGLLSLTAMEQALVGMAGGVALLSGMGLLANVPEALIQLPLLGVLLWRWKEGFVQPDER